ncbi:hypothetical protein DDE82_004270 [Stemphylium lycopersici]|uniref:Uncharacterized protein n=1 Tax=Stemphylium lycopersici TaxID=183478 RepID=A0A364N9Q7_STELY|nr:hypothetical protein TW65_06528 [Stemphylium lycopersici]RAR04792.1 hypothetical protein DDE82_004270 [Stemphylium lycopersici]RAR14078.1 hypothetical protein DDE83_002496 [Stemphylium lycopersici]
MSFGISVVIVIGFIFSPASIAATALPNRGDCSLGESLKIGDTCGAPLSPECSPNGVPSKTPDDMCATFKSLHFCGVGSKCDCETLKCVAQM